MSTTKLKLVNCTSIISRFMGLMFQKKVKNALCFPRCNSIHTFFMRVPILVIITDKNHEVLFKRIVKPWRIILPVKHGYYTYEFPSDFIPDIENNTFKFS